MIDQIGGWSKRSVGEGYGEGYTIMRKHVFLEQSIAHQGEQNAIRQHHQITLSDDSAVSWPNLGG